MSEFTFTYVTQYGRSSLSVIVNGADEDEARVALDDKITELEEDGVHLPRNQHNWHILMRHVSS